MSHRSMQCAVLVRPGLVELHEVPMPEPGPGELVMRVETALTCGTDLKTFLRGHPHIPLPAPLGHEASGVVSAVGAGVRGFKEGDPLICVPTAPCGECRFCRQGRDNLCAEAIGRLNLGAFADYLRIPSHIVSANTFVRPPGMSADVAAAVEPLACVVHGSDRIDWALAGSVVFLGDGAIALLFLQMARLLGNVRILVAGRHTTRLETARALGADAVTTASDGELRNTVLEFTGGAGADVVIECVGRVETWRLAQDLAAAGGTALLFGGCAEGSTVSFDAYRLHYQEVDLLGAFHYGRADVRDALDLLADGQVKIAPLITHRRPLQQLHEALDLVLTRQAIKVAIEPNHRTA
jgi:L-iditol 2-dehydrogenase